MPPYEMIDHLSDIGIKIEANTKEKLFSDAIEGLFSLITGRIPDEINISGNKIRKKRLRVKYDEIDAALIELLNRIIFLTYSKGVLIFNPQVKIKKNKIVLKANAIIQAYDFMEREIKAATYHNFYVREKNGNLSATIIFDI